MTSIKINLAALDLFGNDDAEDESEAIFNSYVLERPEFESFVDAEQRFCIARAYKGEGKSALLRLTQQKVSQAYNSCLVISHRAKTIEPELTSEDYSVAMRKWKAAMLSLIANHIGDAIGIAWNDDAMSLVEEAEKNGFKQRSFVGSIVKRLTGLKVEVGTFKAEIPQIVEPEASDFTSKIQRWSSGKTQIWLILDDVDKNFENTKIQCVKVAAFFDACRELNQNIPEMRIRASIRPNVWTAIKFKFESLSHVEQYIQDLHWAEHDIRTLLAKRIEGYLKRKNQWGNVSNHLTGYSEEDEKYLIALAFDREMQWATGIRPPHAVLYTLSKYRPRWVIELAKLSAKQATKAGHEKISLSDIVENLNDFGRSRVADTVAEFTSQCNEIQEILDAFKRQREQFTTDELLNIINSKILTHLHPQIAGVLGSASALNVAAFLFEIGFIYGRRDKTDDNYEHISFSEKPSLLKSRTSVDDGLKWEVHPAFRQYMEMRDSTGKEIRNRGSRRGHAGS